LDKLKKLQYLKTPVQLDRRWKTTF